MNLNEERELIARVRQDRQVFGQLFESYYPQIFGYVLKRIGDVAIAQDITSEVFAKALQRLWQFRWRNVSFSVWLYKIAVNEASYYFRKQRLKSIPFDRLLDESGIAAADDLEAELVEAQEALERYQDFLYIQQQISQLPIPYQEVLTLRFFDNKKIREICDILDKKERTVKSLLSRGLAQLRARMVGRRAETQVQPLQALEHYEGEEQIEIWR